MDSPTSSLTVPPPAGPLVELTRTQATIVEVRTFTGPGKTLGQIYTRLALSAEKRANRAAHTFGLGPQAVSDRIQAFFGDASEREEKLGSLGNDRPPRLEKDCAKLLEYALPSESTRTQLQAFTNIVTLITRYPGLRRIILNSKAIRHVVESGVAISRLWNSSGDHRDSQWKFYCEFASACITDKDISTFVEGFSTSDLSGSVDQQGLTVIETLLVAVDSQGLSKFIAIRYLGGILELPSFWLQTGPIFRGVFKKILSKLALLLKDLGVDSLDPTFDHTQGPGAGDSEGIEILSEAVLAGLFSWTIASENRSSDFSSEYWYSDAWTILQLLRHPRTEHILPRSWEEATSRRFYHIVPAECRPRDLVGFLSTELTPGIGRSRDGLSQSEDEQIQDAQSPANINLVLRPLVPSDLPCTTIYVDSVRVKSKGPGKRGICVELRIDPGNDQQPWRLEKTYSQMSTLDRRVRRCVGREHKMISLPQKHLLNSCAPIHQEERKAVLQSYFQALLVLPVDAHKEMIAFFTSDVIWAAPPPENGQKRGYVVKGYYRWKMKYVVLDGPSLKYYTSPGGKFERSINLVGAQIGKQPPEETNRHGYRHAVLVTCPDSGPHIFCAESGDEAEEWVQKLSCYVSGSYRP
ncbi:hypothetical protein B0H13DRAFT_2648967, partial [Mycena leptocephala]